MMKLLSNLALSLLLALSFVINPSPVSAAPGTASGQDVTVAQSRVLR